MVVERPVSEARALVEQLSVVVVRLSRPLALRILLMQQIISRLRELGGFHIDAPEAGCTYRKMQSHGNGRVVRVLVGIVEDLAGYKVGLSPKSPDRLIEKTTVYLAQLRSVPG